MLVECGYVRATASDGAEFTFCPSFSRIASLGSPKEIVSLYAGLHGPRAAREAAYVLACLCEQDDPIPLLGGKDICKEAPPVRTQNWWAFLGRFAHEPQTPERFIDVSINAGMPASEQIIIARHLMEHGIVGKAKPLTGGGSFSDSFDASEYIAAACVHLGLTRSDAEQLSMTEFQIMFEMKFPDQNKKADVPTREEYEAGMKAIKERAHV